MIYYTGDTHGQFGRLIDAIENNIIEDNSIIVILGDVGLNYYGNNNGDRIRKGDLNAMIECHDIILFCIHGNHEMRPESIDSYVMRTWHDGVVYYEPEFPNLLFAQDGEIYDLNGRKSIVIGGAYSVDKFYRLRNFVPWFKDEQPSDEIKHRVEAKLEEHDWIIDQVLTHTCPYAYMPTDMFLDGIDQSTVDQSTEQWLNSLELKLKYTRWLCGHWHTDRTVDRIGFLYHNITL